MSSDILYYIKIGHTIICYTITSHKLLTHDETPAPAKTKILRIRGPVEVISTPNLPTNIVPTNIA